MPTFWIRPEDINHCLMVMVQTDSSEQAFIWSRSMELATKPFNGFCQISRPDGPCSTLCDEHWRCPGIEGWELFGHHNVTDTAIVSILWHAQRQAERMQA